MKNKLSNYEVEFRTNFYNVNLFAEAALELEMLPDSDSGLGLLIGGRIPL